MGKRKKCSVSIYIKWINQILTKSKMFQILIFALVMVDDLYLLNLPPQYPCVLCLNGEVDPLNSQLDIPSHCVVVWDDWRNPSHNRNLCFKHAQDHLIDQKAILSEWWLLRWDADFGALRLPKESHNNNNQQVIRGMIETQTSTSLTPLLIRANVSLKQCKYKGIVCEIYSCNDSVNVGYDTTLLVFNLQAGKSKQGKIERIIEKTKKELELESIDVELHEQYLFCRAIAIASRDGCIQKAKDAFKEHIEFSHINPQHLYYSKYQLAICSLYDEKRAPMIKVYESNPERIEPLYHIAEYFRTRGQFLDCIKWAKKAKGLNLPQPNEYRLDKAIYQYGLVREESICLMAIGKKKEALKEWEKVSGFAPSSVNKWFDKYKD
jgi:tetratricopeptide (TPR) repeat protein